MKIYTKSGDCGNTLLLSGERVGKNHPHVIAYGTVDECNCSVGLAITFLKDPNLTPLQEPLYDIQKTLFEVGASLALPLKGAKEQHKKWVRTDFKRATQSLEEWIDSMDQKLPPLKNFILPGGHPASCFLHQARSIARHAERHVYSLCQQEKENVSSSLLPYLNRLSDALFTAARYANLLSQTPEKTWISSADSTP